MDTTENTTVVGLTAVNPVAAVAETTPAPSAEAKDSVKQEPTAKTYDQAYIDKLLADQEAATKAEVEEALKVAKMDDTAKADCEKEKAFRELADREALIAMRELKADAAVQA